jgi:hypothetical protein
MPNFAVAGCMSSSPCRWNTALCRPSRQLTALTPCVARAVREPFAAMNADRRVMEHLPSAQNRQQRVMPSSRAPPRRLGVVETTTNGKSANAATSPEPRWPYSTNPPTPSRRWRHQPCSRHSQHHSPTAHSSPWSRPPRPRRTDGGPGKVPTGGPCLRSHRGGTRLSPRGAAPSRPARRPWSAS